MRMMMKVAIPCVAGNKALKEGVLPKTMMGFVEKYHPETAVFGAENGKRTAFFVFDLKDPSDMPSAAEPFFTNLEAEITTFPVMNLEDMKNGVARAMKNA